MLNIFLSWSSADDRMEPLVEIIREWFDELFPEQIDFFFCKEVGGGKKSIDELHQAIESTDIGFVLLSQYTINSPWVLYEYGALNPHKNSGKIFPILFDVSAEEIRSASTPFEAFQAISLENLNSTLVLVEQVCKALGFDKRALSKTLKIAAESYQDCLEKVHALHTSQQMLPDYFSGKLLYGNTIHVSKNFQMPEIFRYFKDELFLVGMNLNFLLNLLAGSDRFDALLDELLSNSSKRIRILISDLWDEHLFIAYDKTILGHAQAEMDGLNKVFKDENSDMYLDTYIQNYCASHGEGAYVRVKKQLEIKTIGLLMDTFWFVDVDESKDTGDALIIPMTASSGDQRPVFYANYKEHKAIFNNYHSVCRAGYNTMSTVLWPLR